MQKMACSEGKRPHRYVRWECSGTGKSLTLSSGLCVCVCLGQNGPQKVVTSDKTSLQGYPGKSSKVKGFTNKIMNGWIKTLVTWSLMELIAAPAGLYNCISLERSLVLSVVFMHQTQHEKPPNQHNKLKAKCLFLEVLVGEWKLRILS